ncbi:hypothetical protein P3T76_005755 [Phytophthora citrophthora]|uniref:Uncharacterized protein n=1 Tax=Phytophthora citrophthora TaxID=4793 RepID=A0AAD9LMV2_9STRA|nr:hypothetical protein P3T76_005755 [Phytophthora citrophthora]
MTLRARATSSSRQRIVAAYSSKSKNSKSKASATATKRQMAVINWENVLVPLGWMMTHLGLGTSTSTIDLKDIQSQSQCLAELPSTFAAIEDEILELLTVTMRSVKGPVFIVSEYPTVYVEFVCYLFFPRLTAALRSATTGIYVVGTPDTQLNDSELNLWKVNLLRTMVLERVFANVSANDAANPTSGRLDVFALCATKVDVAAMSTLHSDAPYSIVKSVRVKTGAIGLGDFYRQLQTLTQFVKQAVAANYPMNVDL